jgi:hypothetical protein
VSHLQVSRVRASRFAFVLAAALVAAAPSLAWAEEASGCDAFKWPLDRERAALLASRPAVDNGAALPYGAAVTLKLGPLADAGLPQAPERASKFEPSNAGHFTLAAPSKAGVYKITIGAEAWVDVIDEGAFLHPKSFSGAKGCEGARKSVKFDLPARPLLIQVSGVRGAELTAIVTPAE